MTNKTTLALCLLVTVCVVEVFSGCSDTLSTCHNYAKSSCKAPYEDWARKNCAKYCGYCVSKKAECTSHGIGYAAGDLFQDGCGRCTCMAGGGIGCSDLGCPWKFDAPKNCGWIRANNQCCDELQCLPGVKVTYPKYWKKVPKRYGLIKN